MKLFRVYSVDIPCSAPYGLNGRFLKKKSYQPVCSMRTLAGRICVMSLKVSLDIYFNQNICSVKGMDIDGDSVDWDWF